METISDNQGHHWVETEGKLVSVKNIEWVATPGLKEYVGGLRNLLHLIFVLDGDAAVDAWQAAEKGKK